MDNPFFEDWTAPFGAPPLDRIEPAHFPQAYDRALADHAAEIARAAKCLLRRALHVLGVGELKNDKADRMAISGEYGRARI